MSKEVKKELARDEMSKSYPAECCFCGKTVRVCRSLGMLLGWLDTGSGTCPCCKNRVRLELDREKDTMTISKLDTKSYEEIKDTIGGKIKEKFKGKGEDLC